MVKARAQPSLSVFQILNKAQDGTAGHRKFARLLWEVVAENAGAAFAQLTTCISHLLLVTQGTSTYAERAVKFIATFTSARPTSEDAEAFVEDLISHLTKLSQAADKSVRTWVCQLLELIMNSLPPDSDLSEDLIGELQIAMLERVRDKQAGIRCHAVKVLMRLADPEEEGDYRECPVIQAYSRLLAGEKNKDVRKAVLACLPSGDCTVPLLIERTRDCSDEVRKVAFLMLAQSVHIRTLSIAHRALLLRRGLRDRVGSVSDAAYVMLQSWLAACQGDVLDLLQALDVETFEDEAKEALLALHSHGALHPVELAHAAGGNGVGLRRSPEDEPLSPEESLLWRVVCETLQQEATRRGQAAAATTGAAAAAEAAVADDLLQAVESALPETAAHLMQLTQHLASQGKDHRFAARQLLSLACTCMDLSDACGHRAAADLVATLLDVTPGLGAADCLWGDAVMGLACQVYVNPSQLASALLSQIAAALPCRTALEEGTGGTDDADRWTHCLCVASLLLKNIPSVNLDVEPAGAFERVTHLFTHLIYPVLPHGPPAVRAEAVRALCLLGVLLARSPPSSEPDWHVPQLVITMLSAAASKDEPGVRLMAVRALCDLAIVWCALHT